MVINEFAGDTEVNAYMSCSPGLLSIMMLHRKHMNYVGISMVGRSIALSMVEHSEMFNAGINRLYGYDIEWRRR